MSEEMQLGLLVLVVTSMIAPTWLAWWNSRFTKRQWTPNGGSSAVDVLSRIENKVDRADMKASTNHEKIELIRDRQGTHIERQKAIERKLDDHIEYMASVHERTNKKERSTD